MKIDQLFPKQKKAEKFSPPPAPVDKPLPPGEEIIRSTIRSMFEKDGMLCFVLWDDPLARTLATGVPERILLVHDANENGYQITVTIKQDVKKWCIEKMEKHSGK